MQTLQQLLSGQLKGATKLKLSCGLRELPSQVFDLAETLEILDLSGNLLSHLPEDFGRLKHLKIIFLSDNSFTEFPAVLAQCPALEMIAFKANKISRIPEEAFPAHLRWLILTNNQIAEIPASIGRCLRMQKLMLAGNRLKQLPPELAYCQHLELLRISANKIEVLPEWLLRMPRLSWLAYSGNPCSAAQKVEKHLPQISWNALQLEELLGEGASGFISKAHWQGGSADRAYKAVAVKVFKGEVTSDGLPADEMAASMAAASHPNLMQVLGKISGHPQQKKGLVLDLVPPTYKILGSTPSFASCTRDVYPEDTRFSWQQAITIATGIADAALHLHARGILHGDLYAHNILTDSTAYPLLGDFGAATLYQKADSAKALLLERLEVRAFGCLLEDLLEHLAPLSGIEESVEALIQLKKACMHEDVSQRPGFATIYEHLLLTSVSAEEVLPNY